MLPPGLRARAALTGLAYNHLLPTTSTTANSSVVVLNTEAPSCPLQRKQTRRPLPNLNRGADLVASLSRVPNAAGEWRAPTLAEQIWQLIVVQGSSCDATGRSVMCG